MLLSLPELAVMGKKIREQHFSTEAFKLPLSKKIQSMSNPCLFSSHQQVPVLYCNCLLCTPVFELKVPSKPWTTALADRKNAPLCLGGTLRHQMRFTKNRFSVRSFISIIHCVQFKEALSAFFLYWLPSSL